MPRETEPCPIQDAAEINSTSDLRGRPVDHGDVNAFTAHFAMVFYDGLGGLDRTAACEGRAGAAG
jgi:hypothetical protein